MFRVLFLYESEYIGGFSNLHYCTFKKNPNQSFPKKMINKYANRLDVLFKKAPWRKHKHDINIFWGENFFWKMNKQRQSLICLKSCEMNNFLAILEFCAFYIKYKNAKFTELTFVVEPMLNILCKHSFCNCLKIPQKFLLFPC